MNLFDLIEPPPIPGNNWVPQEPPCLDGITDIQLNFETTGLRWWAEDVPIGCSIYYGDKTQYIPWGHRGGNLDEDTCKRWAQRELRNKRITNANTRFDVHFGYKWGVDLEEQGCVFSDVSHYAALLDDHRKRFGIDLLAQDYLPGQEPIPRLDESRMREYHAGQVAPRSEYNVKLVRQLRNKMWPLMTEQGLHKVRMLEEAVIPVVCEMERNGTKINIELLDKWIKEITRELHNCYMGIFNVTGLRVNPDSPKDMQKLFQHLKLGLQYTEAGRASFTADILKKIDHPVVKLAFRAGKLADVQSKLKVYAASVNRSTGILRYALHQLRAQKEEFDESSSGTVSGRFSGTKISSNPPEGINIQAVTKPAKQRILFGLNEDDDSHDDELYIIRALHIPENGLFLSADAMQIEYRIFAHETNSTRLTDIYKNDPLASFHRKTHAMLKDFIPSLDYRRGKDVNFATIYGAGIRKMGLMLRYYGQEDYLKLLADPRWWDSPLIQEVKKIKEIYNREIPEVKPLIERAQNLAKNRGYVQTLLGRRSRFINGARSHKALNARIQGSAADIMKVKLIEIHKARKETGFTLRWTVHDEMDGDVPDKESARKVAEILNHQSFPLRVPIMWETNVGPNWKELEELAA